MRWCGFCFFDPQVMWLHYIILLKEIFCKYLTLSFFFYVRERKMAKSRRGRKEEERGEKGNS